MVWLLELLQLKLQEKIFDECKKKSLPNDIARQTGISIRQEKSNRSYEIHTDNELSSPSALQLNHYNHLNEIKETPSYPYAYYNQYPYSQTPQRDEVYYNLSNSISASSPIYIEYPDMEEEVAEIETFGSDDDNYVIEQ